MLTNIHMQYERMKELEQLLHFTKVQVYLNNNGILPDLLPD